MTQEIWKDIPNFPKYQISSFGRIKSSWSSVRTSKRYGSFRILKGGVDKDGYKRNVFVNNKCRKSLKVHELVALVFIGPRPFGLVCTHKDGKKENNNVENLVYKTQKENIEDRTNHGTTAIGERHGLATLTTEIVQNIKLDLKDGKLKQTEIAKKYGASKSQVNAIFKNKTWKHAKIP